MKTSLAATMIKNIVGKAGNSSRHIPSIWRSPGFRSCASTKATNALPSEEQAMQSRTSHPESIREIERSKSPERKKTQEELDEDLRQKLESISGGGGEAGLELENGQPVAMKRGVKQNMFRLI